MGRRPKPKIGRKQKKYRWMLQVDRVIYSTPRDINSISETETDWQDFDKYISTQLFNAADQTVQDTPEKTDSDGFSADEFYVVLDKPYQYCERDNLEEFVEDKSYRIFKHLKRMCRTLDIEDFMFFKFSKGIKFVQMYDSDSVSSIPRAKLCVSVDRNLDISIAVHDQYLPTSHAIWNVLRKKCYSISSVKKVLSEIRKYDICTGNQDPDLQYLIPVCGYPDVPVCGYPDAPGQPKYQAFKEGHFIGSTIRSKTCLLLVCQRGKRCCHCGVYRRTLKKTQARNEAKESVPTPDWKKSKTSNNKLTESQKIEKIEQFKTYSSYLESENMKLNKKITQNINKSSNEPIKNSFPDEKCYQRLFWEQQLKYSKLKDKKSMRWHPMMIKWCTFLKSKSIATYDALRNSGFVSLPSIRTLTRGNGVRPANAQMLTEKVNPDPIEQYFDVHRSSKGCNTNPNLNAFNNAIFDIQTVGSHDVMAPFRGNSKRRFELNEIDDTRLQKRKRYSH